MRLSKSKLVLISQLMLASSLVVHSVTATATAKGINHEDQLKKINDESHSLSKFTPVHASQSASSSKVANSASQQHEAIKSEQLDIAPQSHKASSNFQPIAEKKQGDAAISDSLLNNDEYVQVKPEEISANEQGKEIDAVIAAAVTGNSQQSQPIGEAQPVAEHKSSVDDELNAHLAQDLINPQESSYRPQAASYPARSYGPQHGSGQRGASYNRPSRHMGGPMRAPRGGHSGSRMPPSYTTLKGKLTGINSIISQYPHPAPGYPHQGPRHLPRGAAAGYAAFRDFVRAHANKYKSVGHPSSQPGTIGPQYRPASHQINKRPAPGGYGGQRQHGHELMNAGYGPMHSGADNKGYRGQSSKTKVTVAQAYIPHLTPSEGSAGYESENGGYGGKTGGSMKPYVNPMLAKLYGNHAPQGVGKPEYNKDYGMVIHYPQATVYTEPMTMDQLHKLTGNGIGSVIEHLQYNLANGHRDETNTLRGNKQHHIGNGVTIHAKEYYAPGKGGRYVPTTAAVISTQSGKTTYGEQQGYSQEGGYQNNAEHAPEQHEASVSKGPVLGAGYERVKQAAAASSDKYNNKHRGNLQAPVAYENQEPKYSGHEEPLTSITNLIGSELDALYKANAALTKDIEPEIHAQIQAYTKSNGYSNGNLNYHEVDAKSPLVLHGNQHQQSQRGYNQPLAGLKARREPRGRGHQGQNHYGNGYQNRPQQYRQQQQVSIYGNNRPQQQHRGAHMHQQQAYRATEKALNQQMMQLLHDFKTGDEQYNGKTQPMHAVNQGYPHKVMQKHHQQQQAYANQQQAYGNQQNMFPEHHEGLEIPKGPNDQIGEISDLIEALKGSLESNRPDQISYGGEHFESARPQVSGPAATASKIEDVNYLTSALGQAPSYSAQVPVANQEHETAKKAAETYQQQATPENGANQHQQATGAYQQPAQYQANEQPASQGYHQQPQAKQHEQQQVAQPLDYNQQPQQIDTSYGNQQQAASYNQQPASYGQQQSASLAGAYQQEAALAQVPTVVQPAGYGQAQASVSGYNNQEAQAVQGNDYQQQGDYSQSSQQQSDYSQQQQVTPMASVSASSGSGYTNQVNSNQQQDVSQGVYPQDQSQGQQNGYSGNEHSQVINHLVPVAAAPATQSSFGSYESSSSNSQTQHSSGAQQPANQISIAAPTDSQYQQAQSLSSFVDSLPTDYQELLRQPALIDSNSGAAHLAAIGQETNGYQSNASSTTGASQAATSYGAQSGSSSGGLAASASSPVAVSAVSPSQTNKSKASTSASVSATSSASSVSSSSSASSASSSSQ